MSLHIIRKKKCFTVFFQLLLGVFFSTRSVALVDDLPNMEESQGYKSSARFVVKYSITAMTVKVYTFQSRLITFQKKSEPPYGATDSDTLVFLLSEPLKFGSEGFKILSASLKKISNMACVRGFPP